MTEESISEPGSTQRFQMKIYVSQVSEDEGLRVEHQFPDCQPALKSADRQIVGRPVVRIEVRRKGSEVRLKGNLNASVRIDCARCLLPLQEVVDESFDLFYIPPIDSVRPDDEKELAVDDLLAGFYQNDEIDLDDFVREQVELALPMAPVCREDCRGLCPKCGTNLNESECSCTVTATDHRWSALEEWKM